MTRSGSYRNQRKEIVVQKRVHWLRSSALVFVLIAAGVAQLGVALSPTALAQEATGTPAVAGEPLDITLLTTYNGLPFYTAMLCGALDAAKEAGGTITVTSEGPPHGMNVSEQLPILNAAINARPDGIILVPADPRALVAVVEAAMAEGLPIVTTDQALEKEVAIAHFGADNKAGGKLAAEEMLRLIGDASGTILVLDNRPGLPVTNLRAEGFIEALKDHPNLKLLETQYNSDDPNKAATQAQAALQSNPDLIGVFATAEAGAMGAAAGLQGQPAAEKVNVVAYDAGPTLVRALRDGTLDALIAQGSYGQGHDAMIALVDYIRTGEKPAEYTHLVPNVVVTRDNMTNPEVVKFLYPDRCPGQ
jgi:ribose transport system substrate-binding protein